MQDYSCEITTERRISGTEYRYMMGGGGGVVVASGQVVGKCDEFIALL
jgi:hypothetical protein